MTFGENMEENSNLISECFTGDKVEILVHYSVVNVYSKACQEVSL